MGLCTIYSLDVVELFKCSEVEIIDPDVHQNSRLISQSGILMKIPLDRSFEDFIEQEFKGSDTIVMQKIIIKKATQLNICFLFFDQ